MATKSRLGMGLGALFPSLPGESAKSEAVAEPAAPAVGGKADNKPSAKTSGSMAGSAAVPSVRKNTGAKSSMATAQASVDAVHDMKKNVSHETKKGSVHRASMPSITLNEAAHPADMFFGATSPVDPSADAKRGSVSRETAAVKKNEDAKNNEPELLPVQGGYLVELRLSDVGPNLHQPRTIFDEDDLRELADSIKEVGVLQPIVVRKRPLAQIEAARKENAASNDESHNMFDGRMDSMYELIMGERRWRASQIAGLKTIPAIANTLRLLNLPATVQKKVASGLLSAGHARALLGLPAEADMEQLATRIIAEGLSVRSTEEIVSMKAAESDQPKKAKTNKLNPWAGTPMQLGLEKKFGTKVSIKGSKEHGRIEIVFKSEEDMKRIVDMLIPSAEE